MQGHFDDFCEPLGVDKPRGSDHYCFKRGAGKTSGGVGWGRHKCARAAALASLTQAAKLAEALPDDPQVRALVAELARGR